MRMRDPVGGAALICEKQGIKLRQTGLGKQVGTEVEFAPGPTLPGQQETTHLRAGFEQGDFAPAGSENEGGGDAGYATTDHDHL